MKISFSSLANVALLLPVLVLGVVGAPQTNSGGGLCRDPIVRKEWYDKQNLSNYIMINV